MSKAPYHWVKEVTTSLQELQEIPLWGSPPPFPWEESAQKLQEALGLPTLLFSHLQTSWKEADQLAESFGKNPLHISLEMAPLEGKIHWIFSRDDLSKWVKNTLSSENLVKGFSDVSLEEGYFELLALQALTAFNTMNPYGDLLTHLAPPTPLPNLGALCVDVQVKLKEETLLGRLVVPSPFLHAFRHYFAKQMPAAYTSPLTKEIMLPLSLQAGYVTLPTKQAKQLAIGDFLILDNCSIDPHTKKGSLYLTLQNNLLFHVRLKDDTIELVDYTNYYEEKDMPKDYEETPNDDEFDESDYDEEEAFDDEEFAEEGAPEEDALTEEKQTQEESHSAEVGSAGVGEAIETSDIPVTISVEIARMRMNLEKLLELRPGNVLDLKVNIDRPVDLCINGKKIAQAELLKLGNFLGVKILETKEKP